MIKICFILAYLTLILLIGSCAMPAVSKTDGSLRTSDPTPVVGITPTATTANPSKELTELCRQLHEIKRFPGRDPSEKEDSSYAEIMARSEDMMPCLVDEIANETPMDDPRSAPSWQHYKVGDTAVFLLARMVKNPQILREMLPQPYQDEWKINGVYAYFNYVSKSENRKELQKWWRTRLKKTRQK